MIVVIVLHRHNAMNLVKK